MEQSRSGNQELRLEGHTELVTSLILSPNEAKLASASVDTYIKIWDLATGKCTSTLSGHTDKFHSLAWPPNQIASGSSDGSLKIWNTITGECISTLKCHDRIIEEVAWSPDNARLAGASADSLITVWDPKTYQCIFTLNDDDSLAWWHLALVWSQDGGRIARASMSGVIKTWDTDTRDCVASFRGDGNFDSFGQWTSERWQIRLRTLLEKRDYDPETHERLSIPRTAGYDFNEWYKWITYSGEPFLKLPTEYQPHATAVGKNFIGIGCRSGRVLLLQFSDVNPLI